MLRPDEGNAGARRHAVKSTERLWRHTACGLPVVLVDLTPGDWRELPAELQCQGCHVTIID